MDPLDTKKRFMKELREKVSGDRGTELKGRYGLKPPPDPFEAEFGKAPEIQVPKAPLEDADESLFESLLAMIKPKAEASPPAPVAHPEVKVPMEQGSMAMVSKPWDSDLELLNDLVPSKTHVNGKVSTPVSREWMDQNDPEFADRKLNVKRTRDALEDEEEGG